MTRTVALAACACALGITAATASAADPEPPAGTPMLGKYGCSESVFTTDGYTQESRGFVRILAKHKYRQGKGKVGRYKYNAKSGVTKFIGGSIAGSTATGIDGKRNRLFITVKFKHGETANWACTRIGKA